MTLFNNFKVRHQGTRRRSAALVGTVVAVASLLACGGGTETPDGMADRKAGELLAKMTQAEKIQLVHGAGFPAVRESKCVTFVTVKVLLCGNRDLEGTFWPGITMAVV